MKNSLLNLIGTVPKETGFIKAFRFHQGWWRAFVLKEKEGQYRDPQTNETKQVCNRLNDGEKSQKNFLTPEIAQIAIQACKNHNPKSGIIEEKRLFNNLLSSQPLAFNFFGLLKLNPKMALNFVQAINPSITEVKDIMFEYAPDSSNDNSAFDVAFFVSSGLKKGFIGLECKYTDKFSYKRKGNKLLYGEEGESHYENYYSIYCSNRNRFPDEYNSYVKDKHFNQLFRNEILAVQLQGFDFIITGLFCHHDDVE